ncbi:glycosyltransferase family 4 protein [Aeromicrobium chenweiae]|uniref:Group 1 glycosyl transferase n=1 Tax=Aeromicrobium chenweiae TaxID=2079793 RepID=A0A2S0WIR7_9ACTN|nr:glycosyltransferase family 4 protein [Aeromicrobium chenweiae]AWB91197.1 group 1 glycosyl transferase [Aeromicrobium chenweiae]TGN31715.1 glycosyltransferase family 1 protein [Aeromicrobium chenweiae]
MTRVTVVLKTNEGGAWVLGQVAEMVRRGAHVTIVIPPGDGRLRRAVDAAGHPVAESPFDFSFRPAPATARGLWRLRKLVRATAPDVVFYHLYASALAARIASLGLRVRRVHMVAGPLYLENPVIRFVERFLCRLDHHLIAGSEFTATQYAALGMPADRLSYVPYGVDVQRFSRGVDSRDRLWGAGSGTFVAIMVAYVYAPKSSVFPGVGIKGHDLLLECWREFSAAHPDARLVLVGSGFDDEGERHRQGLIGRFELAADPTVSWLDSVTDVRPLYSSADVSISPSLSENHGAALEASAMGVPSIVSRAGGLPETVTPCSGWVVPVGDRDQLLAAMTEAWSRFETGSLAEMGRQARAHALDCFDLTRSTARVADIVLA